MQEQECEQNESIARDLDALGRNVTDNRSFKNGSLTQSRGRPLSAMERLNFNAKGAKIWLMQMPHLGLSQLAT